MSDTVEETQTDTFVDDPQEGGVEKLFGVQTPVMSDPVDITPAHEGMEDPSSFDIEIVDDAPEEDQGKRPAPIGAEPTDEELGEISGNVQKRINSLTRKYNDERRSKEAAERLADEAANHAKRLFDDNRRIGTLVHTSHEALVQQTQHRAKGSLDMATLKHREAHESGDADAIAFAQQEMMNAQLALSNAPAVSQQIIRAWQAEERAAAQQNPQAPVAAPQMPEPDLQAQEWQDNNQWFGMDKVMTSTAYGVHEELVANGVDPTSEEYYTEVDARMRQIFPENFGDASDASQDFTPVEAETARGPRRVPVVAPVGRNNSVIPRKITLTATQVALAKRLGLTTTQYAEQLIKEGRA